MGFRWDREMLIGALRTPRVWGLGKMGSVLKKYLLLLGFQWRGVE
jgi:hypothetical protein